MSTRTKSMEKWGGSTFQTHEMERDGQVCYAARPPYALHRVSWADGKVPSLLYTPPQPLPDGRTALHLTPRELLERPAALIPPAPTTLPYPSVRPVGAVESTIPQEASSFAWRTTQTLREAFDCCGGIERACATCSDVTPLDFRREPILR
jgi:hypothetical protein